MSLNGLKNKSGVKLFASVLGKSTIGTNSEEYKMIQEITKILLNNNFGVIHGGYAGGAMSAVSDTAHAFIKEHKLAPSLNIGIPQKQHDGLWERVKEAEFTEAAEDIFERLKLVSSGDIAVICPLGGDGTELEAMVIFHENVIKQGLNQKTKPLIFLQTKTGTNWKKIIETKMSLLATSVKNPSEYSWLYFANSLEEFKNIIQRLK